MLGGVSTVSVTLSGGFAATVDGVPLAPNAWRLKKARELVKLLALAPSHRLHREQAMDALWGDRTPDAAANNLHQAVYVARRALGAEAIVVRDEMLELAATVDIDEFELAAANARRVRTPAAYRKALSIYAGELLPENRYDDWATERREEVAELAAELEDELAALPGLETETAPRVPADPSSFVGRRRELAELRALIGRTRLLTLAGTGGTGKSRLALELARAVEDSWTDGAALVELAGLLRPELISDAFAAALEVSSLPGQKSLDAVVEYLTPRRMLLVVDNCEHVLAGSAAVTDAILRAAPEVTVLATSREPLRVPGELVFRVPSLHIADPGQAVDTDDLLRYEAVQLFVERAGGAAPGFALDDENALDVARICFRLDGLPLAIELAAGRLGALAPAAIAARLDDRFRVLRSASHTAPTRQRTLYATLDWSHDLLEDDERILLRRLAVFRGGFGLDAVEGVCADADLDRASIADVLARLVEKSLVAVEEDDSGERRYRLLETVRMYAGERLDEAGETAATASRQAHWALVLAEQAEGSPRLDRDAANLRVALDTLLDGEPAETLRMCVALCPYWLRRIDLDEGHRRLEDALAGSPQRTLLRAQALMAAAALDYRGGTLAHGVVHAEESNSIAVEIGDARAEWRALQLLGEFGIAGDAVDVAMRWLEPALALARREGFAAAEAVSIYSHGVAHWIMGELARAEELVTESIELFDSLAGSSERIPSLLNIVEIRTSQLNGRPGMRIVFEDTLQPFTEISCGAAAGYALANEAGIAGARGERGRARALLAQSGARFVADGDERGQAAVLVRRAYVDFADGTLAAARASLTEALELRRRQRDRRGLGLVLAGLGLIDTAAGEYASAERQLAEARELFHRAGDRWGLASTLWRTADLAIARTRLDDAEAALLEARVVLGTTQRERWIANTLAALAEVAILRGEVDEACALLTDARRRYTLRGDVLGVADVEERLSSLR
jgi:predicted ATPase